MKNEKWRMENTKHFYSFAFIRNKNSKIITDTPDGIYENVSANNSVQEENEWEITRENILIEKVIGKGSFGQVAKGVLRYKSKEEVFKEQVVAVKMTKGKS